MKKTRRGFQGNLSLTGIKGYVRIFPAEYYPPFDMRIT